MVDTSAHLSRNDWTEQHIVPDILSSLPPHESTIAFKGGVKVRPGKQLTVQEVEQPPEDVDWPHDDKDFVHRDPH